MKTITEKPAEFARPEGTRRALAEAIKVIDSVRQTLYMPLGFKILADAIILNDAERDR